jgi:hypothetical protein
VRGYDHSDDSRLFAADMYFTSGRAVELAILLDTD